MFGGRSFQRLVPVSGLFGDFEGDTDLGVGKRKEIPGIIKIIGAESVLRRVGALAVGNPLRVGRIRGQARHRGLLRVEHRCVVRSLLRRDCGHRPRVVGGPIFQVLGPGRARLPRHVRFRLISTDAQHDSAYRRHLRHRYRGLCQSYRRRHNGDQRRPAHTTKTRLR